MNADKDVCEKGGEHEWTECGTEDSICEKCQIQYCDLYGQLWESDE